MGWGWGWVHQKVAEAPPPRRRGPEPLILAASHSGLAFG